MLHIAQGFAVAFLFFQQPQQPQDPQQPEPIRWACRPIRYLENPNVRNAILRARLLTTCDFDAVQGGGFVHLRAHLNERVVHEAQVVHTGPESVVYKDDPAQKYDLTTRVGSATDYSDIRQNVFIASDDRTHLNFDTFSSRITGVGNGQYLKRTDLTSRVSSTTVARKYGVSLEAYVLIAKPWYIPEGVFISQIQQAIENNTQRVEQELITELANNL